MWEKDKKVLRAFKECYANMIESIQAGEEVDYGGTCVEETEALTTYTVGQITQYKNTVFPEVSYKRSKYYNPKIPYFQNL